MIWNLKTMAAWSTHAVLRKEAGAMQPCVQHGYILLSHMSYMHAIIQQISFELLRSMQNQRNLLCASLPLPVLGPRGHGATQQFSHQFSGSPSGHCVLEMQLLSPVGIQTPYCNQS